MYNHDRFTSALKLSFMLVLLTGSLPVVSQVTGIKYQLKYNADSCWYDAFLIVVSGNGTTVLQRQQANAHFTVVVPTGTLIDVNRNYKPLIGNEVYNGTTPVTWYIYSVVGAPTAAPESDFYSFAPDLEFDAHYNDLNAGDTIKLFSLAVDTIFDCGSGIRLFENGTDPGPSAPGMGFINFQHIFNLAEGSGLYTANAPPVLPPTPIINPAPDVQCSAGIEINIAATTTSCQAPLSYDWSGPASFTANTEDIQIVPSAANQSGNYTVRVQDGYGCIDSMVIYAQNKPDAGGDAGVCAGTSFTVTGSNPGGGSWTAHGSNSSGASLTGGSGSADITFDNNASGTYRFVYTVNTCSDTMEIFVNPAPVISPPAQDSLCISGTVAMMPNTGGYWISNQSAVASITSSGIVTALTAGPCTFTYTDFSGGCSAISDTVLVNPKPAVQITGTPEVCIGSNTTLSPASGGLWTSTPPTISQVDINGIVTGLSAGLSKLVFHDAITGCPSDSLDMVVHAVPVALINGPDHICIQDTTTLLPNSGGTWVSHQPSIASVNDGGKVTGLAAGQSTFSWTQTSTGCVSDTSDVVTIISRPTVALNATEICSGTSFVLTPATGGVWVSNNAGVASVIANTGVVTGISEGAVTFTFTSLIDGCAATTDTLLVHARPTLSAGTTELCIGSVTDLMPDSGGSWTSLNTEIVVISGYTAIGVGEGIVSLRFTSSSTGCQNTLMVHVNTRVVASITESADICQGFTTQLSPATGGSWASSNPAVATVNQNGLVTGISAGSATFVFTETATGCNSAPTPPVMVKSLPVVSISGNDSICIGSTTTLLPNSGGTWVSDNPFVADVGATTGVVSGFSSGTATFTYTSMVSGCTSLPTPPVLVLAEPTVNISGPTVICTGSTTTLLPATGGIWTSSDTGIATVSNDGTVTGISAGTVTFTFTESITSCSYSAVTDAVTVTPCFNPDFNVTSTNVPVGGDMSTNDYNTTANTYTNSAVLVSGPVSGNTVLTINTNGSYVFQSDQEGIYTYEIPVCIFPVVLDCPKTTLVITVVNVLSSNKTITANTDIAGTAFNTAVEINTLKNDGCIYVGSCAIDAASVQITSPPASGTATVNALTGAITYTPAIGFAGVVHLTYQVCVSGQAINCDTARQIITVLPLVADNALTAGDDLAITAKSTAVSGNVLLNDTDPQGDVLAVTPQNLTLAEGSFVLNAAGVYTFTPNASFTGPLRVVYEVCDNHVSPLCVHATLYLYVLPELTVNIRVYLEGALMNNGNVNAGGRPLMRDNLRMSPFNGGRSIPNSDPYRVPTAFVNITPKYNAVAPGNLPEFLTIPNPAAVFAVTGRDAIVDWVFVELRSKNNTSTVLATRSGLLQRDGDVTDLDGVSGLRFPGIAMDDYYVAIRHRNHLGAMTKFPQTPQQFSTLVDFSSPSLPLFDFGTTKNNGQDYTGVAMKPNVKPGYMSLWAGDFDGNKKIKSENPNDDINNLFFEIIFFPDNVNGNANFDFTVGYFQGDFDMNSKSKFENPNDDKNMLFAQLLFYPLNYLILSNFDFFIEQLP